MIADSVRVPPPQLDAKWGRRMQNWDQLRTQFGPKIGSNLGPNMGPIWTQNGVQFGITVWSKLDPEWPQIGPKLEPKWGPIWGQIGSNFGSSRVPFLAPLLPLLWLRDGQWGAHNVINFGQKNGSFFDYREILRGITL